MVKARLLYILPTICLWLLAGTVRAQERPDSAMLRRMFAYSASVDTAGSNFDSYTYTKMVIDVKKRNLALLAVPTMYAITHHAGKNKYMFETYDKMKFHDLYSYKQERLLEQNTIPHHRKSLTTVLRYLTPKIYDETIIEDNILSPFCYFNQRYYKYKVKFLMNGTARVYFNPIMKNTQLVEGQALINFNNGRIISTILGGEFDMVHFTLALSMGDEGIHSLVPKDVRLYVRFNFLGSRTDATVRTVYDLPKVISDTIENPRDPELMAKVRPYVLDFTERGLYEEFEKEHQPDTTHTEEAKKKWAKTVFWDILGDNLVNRVKSYFGEQNQGYVRINPILNPLYMGYDNHRGFIYKFDIRFNYLFTPNRELSARIKAGYSFKRKQFYYYAPLMFYYNKRRNGYIQVELRNGNWVANGLAVEDALEHNDSILIKHPQLEWFKDMSLKVVNNYDISDYWSFQAGFMFHRRTAIDKEAYQSIRLPFQHTSAAPMVQLQWRPKGWEGDYITLDYERAFKDFLKGNMSYERIELDAQRIKRLSRLQSLQLRAGAGYYTYKHGPDYFLDFTNFRENYIQGGWNDDWSGEFEVLRSKYYNMSNYYLRSNMTYESPLMVASYIPWLGRFFEMERFYMGALMAERIHPYLEVGYGFTTRLFSCGMFVGSKNFKFDGFEIKFGFELFRHW